MGAIETITRFIPEVAKPTGKLGFKEKLKWTLIILVSYFVLGVIPLYGTTPGALAQFQNLAVLLGARLGSLITLGIGPIVTASIILQLLNGAGILRFDTGTHDGRAKFQATQKLLTYGLIIFEAIIYTFLGGLGPAVGSAGFTAKTIFVILQLCIGSLLIMLMDEVMQKWGFGSGISLFIAAGVSQSVFIRMFSWVSNPNGYRVGALWSFIQGLVLGDLQTAMISLLSIISTFGIFALAIYFQSMKVEIPLSFGRVRGHGIRWPLNFLYTSNIPVILVAALLANIQIGAHLLAGKLHMDPNAIKYWVSGRNIVELLITNRAVFADWHIYAQSFVYLLIFITGSIIFSWFWVQTAGMDAKSQAKNIIRSGLQIPGFRKDPRIIEKVLNRYIGPLTIMGAISVAILAVFANMSGALGSGTGILLTVLILYKMYEDIAKQHMSDMNPMLKGLMGGGN